jgi:nitronate monooxygenase
MPGRAIKNQFLRDVDEGKNEPFRCPYHCIITCDVVNSPYCIALALVKAKIGDLKNGFAFAGANAYRTTEIIPVKKLINILSDEYKAAVA